MIDILLVKNHHGEEVRLATLLNGADTTIRVLENWPEVGSISGKPVILSWHADGDNVIEALTDYRKGGGRCPVILISSKTDEDLEPKNAYSAGADEVLPNNVETREFLAILQSMTSRPYNRKKRFLKVKDMGIDLDSQVVRRAGAIVSFTKSEYRILEFLALHPRHTFSASTLLERLWSSPTEVFDQTIRTHIKNIRRKLDTSGGMSLIRTVPNYGYTIEMGDSNFFI